MGHHPPITGQQIADTGVSSGISGVGWLLIIIAVIVVIYLIYRFTKKKK